MAQEVHTVERKVRQRLEEVTCRMQQPEISLPLLLTVDEVADLLRSTRKSVYEQARKGRLPGTTRIGRKLLFRRDRLLQLIRESSVPSLGGDG